MELTVLANGFLMGFADAIPGISSTTIALVTGIYPRFINSLKNLSPSLFYKILCLIKQKKINKIKSILIEKDLFFLCKLIIMMFIGLISSIFIIPNLIINFTAPTLCLFLGFIIPSCYFIWQKIAEKCWRSYVCLFLGIVFCIFLNTSLKQTSSEIMIQDLEVACLYFFTGGFIAISAMLLPGISGSYILLILGLYFPVINTLKHFITQLLTHNYLNSSDSLLLLSFIFGCILGITIFSRLINYLLNHYNNLVLSFISGIIIASIFNLYPFKVEKITNSKDFVSSTNALPQMDLELLISLCLFTMVMLLTIFFEKKSQLTKLSKKKI